jgi:hypothetical protein
MMISERIQRVIHALEVGVFSRWLQFLPLVVAVIGLAVLYDLNAYRSFNSVEAMDAAQVARNMAEGRGYTTDFIRPFSVYLIQKHNHEVHQGEIQLTNTVDFAEINGAHPDLANAPVYPTVLAGLIKLSPPNWDAGNHKPFWSEGGRFLRYQAEFRIAILNQLLLLVVVALTFLIAKKLFDVQAAWLAAVLTLGADLLWKFSVSGQSTLLLLVIFLGLIWCLVKIEELGRAEQPQVRNLFLLAVTAGVLTGVGMLTRYAFGWTIVPVVVFLALFGGVRRPGLAIATFLAFVLAVTPWIIRNLGVSGTPFGTAGYAMAEGTSIFPGSRLMQSLNPDLPDYYYHVVRFSAGKFLVNIRNLFKDELPQIGGVWVAMLFFTGLLLGLRNAAARRMRYFTMMYLGVFVVVQALGRTQLSTISSDINSENLLVLLTPLAVIFGVIFFLTLLNQMKTPSPQIRLAVIALMVVISCQPLIATLLPPKASTIAYPPYYPPEIQKVASWMKPDELLMSDIPWAVAWYGDHQCTWISMNSQSEFFQFNDYVKQVRGLFLTLNTLDSRLYTECLQGTVDSWGKFALNTAVVGQTPQGFTLRYFPVGVLQSGLFFTDRQRW